ncbi:UDP-2,3-diacylglucosamine diphosphatase [Pokkaliibacter sp. MBI-7]|uniref:UDP-2,3-diacylglucosamine hydrolase n=1 Tax=Proteobacteria bacterium 228 TaxID=2083153 RepID=A0A2S5KIG1_9PROT|nr:MULTISPECIES: UDP-2,3-diacylglucosamine diphosphatase [Pokkaliibacter]MDH2432195.1 UDP-2,3-diacylglucosamine diphosphatase [Pokkaliibacter sp. MBI-7]PPC74393.1 UDP-2,3-diacylglucosamine hydrolase [Pokkaliibacter plantistimulans]
MASNASAKRSVRSIWISDTHLGSKGCQAELLTEFLKHHDCEQLYLVGDIIDGWRMRKGVYWPQSHSNVLRRILTMAKRGTRVTYVTGNHDEFLRRYSTLQLGNITLTDEAEHVTAKGERLLILHGDMFDVITRYHRWLAFLGDSAYEMLLILNRWLNDLRRRFGFGYWSLSAYLKHKVKKAVNFIGEFEEALAHECHKRNFDGVVCGHIHHAEIRDIGKVRYLNCGDWVESCTALVEDMQGEISLIAWVRQRETVVTTPMPQLESST